MVIDTSAIIAILFGEAERPLFLDLIKKAESTMISAATVLETAIVLEARLGQPGSRELDAFLRQTGTEIIPVDLEQIEIARIAWSKYGKGRHPARLNFGDCFAYALAKFLDEPLLAKGNDFSQCDIGVLG
ncbi:MAG: type II toxin-antitoxin system VapC family toxin [Candidatus Acidiferrales bacterium]